MVYTFTYTDCAANTHVWTYTYTIDIPDFTLPANGASTVNCAANANTTNTTGDAGCVWQHHHARCRCGTVPADVAKAIWLYFTYTDCAANTHVWTYTYTIDIPDFTLPADGASPSTVPLMH
jgi:hypothetical protein